MTPDPAGRKTRSKKPARGKDGQARLSAARLAAVQAMYQIEITGVSLEEVLAEFLEFRRGGALDDGETAIEPKTEFFTEVLRGATNRRAEIEDILRATLNETWPLERIEILLRCILRAGVFELLARSAIPARVVISEYVDLADAFFDKAEKGMANAVLDTVAQRLRSDEFPKPESAADVGAAPAG